MADNKTAQEPSMEEILSSIRRIIAEDEPGGQAAAGSEAAGALVPAANPDDEDDDVLELTEIVGEPDSPQPEKSAAPAMPAAAPVPPPPSPAMQETPTMTAQSAEPLISPVAANASTNAFARLAKAAAPDDKRTVSVAGISVEQLVVDLLTPMLRDWLDQNLPGIVERVVEQEVKKLARRAELT
jgi:cell pole-organizing protein PopZ